MNKMNFIKIAGATGAIAALAFGMNSITKQSQISFSELSKDDNVILCKNSQLSNLCDRMSIFKRNRQKLFTTLLQHSCNLSSFYDTIDSKKHSFASIRHCATLVSKVVETIRKYRAYVEKDDPKMLIDFDEVASDFQKALNDISHNVQSTVETQNYQ